jgi:hypothetical protein
MKILEEKINRGESRIEVVQAGKKKYTRIASVKGIDWRRYKTNHQVKQVEFERLEGSYKNHFPIHFSPSAFTKEHKGNSNIWPKGAIPVIEDDKKRRDIERQVVSMYANGNGSKLVVVKYVKEQMGWGLKDSKSFVDAFLERTKTLRKYYD